MKIEPEELEPGLDKRIFIPFLLLLAIFIVVSYKLVIDFNFEFPFNFFSILDVVIAFIIFILGFLIFVYYKGVFGLIQKFKTYIVLGVLIFSVILLIDSLNLIFFEGERIFSTSAILFWSVFILIMKILTRFYNITLVDSESKNNDKNEKY